MLKKIATDKAPAAIGPYSQAIAAGDFLFASGQIPINPANGTIEAEGIEAKLEEAGFATVSPEEVYQLDC